METIPFTKILVATDFSELSENAVKTAALMCQMQNATLIMVNVIEDIVLYSQPEISYLIVNHLPEMKGAAKTRLKRMGNKIRKKYNIKVSELVTIGDISTEICKKAQEKNPNLIIVGTHGTAGFRRFFIGSTAYRVIKNSLIPVMTVPGHGDWTSFKRILFPNETPRGKQRGILKQSQLFTFMQNRVFFLKPLVSDVLCNTRLISKLADRVHKISIRPKLSSPQLFFHFWMLFEHFSGGDTLYHPNNLTGTFCRNRLNQKMNVILVCPNFKKVNLISLFNLKTNFFDCHIHCFTKHHFPVLCWTNKMIQQYRYIMRFMYVFAFAHTYKDISFSQQAAGN